MLRKICFFIITLILLFGLPGISRANNLAISNVRLGARDQAKKTIEVLFDISWDNSWRNSTNYDAVWVYLKAPDSTNYDDDHVMLYEEGINPRGTSAGTNSNLEIWVPGDKAGAFIYRMAGGAGSVSSVDVKLIADYEPDNSSYFTATDTASIQIRVYGLEMVYIPEGDFYIGDGDGSMTESTNAFNTGSGSTTLTPRLISTSLVTVNSYPWSHDIRVDGDEGVDMDNDGDVDIAGYPTGYLPFYIMKYELTQEQYRDLLNVSGRFNTQDNLTNAVVTAANVFPMVTGPPAVPTLRQAISTTQAVASGPQIFGMDLNDNTVFNEAADGENLAMNYLSWYQMAAWADWAGLRPITEFEFEKAARGFATSVTTGELPGGLATANKAIGTILNGGTENETTDQVGMAGQVVHINSGCTGPLRVGFAATSSTNRQQANVSYFGVMEMGGNVAERVIWMGHCTKRYNYSGWDGDGIRYVVANSCDNDNYLAYQPGWRSGSSQVINTDNAMSGFRGGSFRSSANANCAISSRELDNVSYADTVNSMAGARYGRWGMPFQRKLVPATALFQYTSGGTNPWSNVSVANLREVDAGEASEGTAGVSHWLRVYNWGFNIPQGATIKGIIVGLHRRISGGTATDNNIAVINSANTYYTPATTSNLTWSATTQYVSWGGPYDTWGANWTPAIVNDTNFGSGYKVNVSSGTVYVNAIEMTVYYSYP